MVKGDPADGLYQVLAGVADVEVIAPGSGGQPAVAVVRQYKVGDFFGERALVSARNSGRLAPGSEARRLALH